MWRERPDWRQGSRTLRCGHSFPVASRRLALVVRGLAPCPQCLADCPFHDEWLQDRADEEPQEPFSGPRLVRCG